MAKTVSELLQPRYKVIAPFPGHSFKVGDFVEPHPFYGFDLFPYPAKYPHLFKPLQWHEDRAKEDMPMYLKEDRRIWKLINWNKDFIGNWTPVNEVDMDGESKMSASISWFFNKERMLPATEEEYDQFITKQPQ